MENRDKLREPDNSGVERDNFGAMNHPARQFFSEISKRRNSIYGKDDEDQANLNYLVGNAEDGQDLGVERGTYIFENKNDAKCASEHESSDEEPLKAPDVPNVRKDTGNDFMEIRDINFGFSIVNDSIPHFFKPLSAPIHSTPLVSKRVGKLYLDFPKEAVEDEEYWRKNDPPSYLEDESTRSQRQWYRSREERSQTIGRKSACLIIPALVFTFFTALFLILLFDYLNAE